MLTVTTQDFVRYKFTFGAFLVEKVHLKFKTLKIKKKDLTLLINS